jgi:hypothetical protein
LYALWEISFEVPIHCSPEVDHWGAAAEFYGFDIANHDRVIVMLKRGAAAAP